MSETEVIELIFEWLCDVFVFSVDVVLFVGADRMGRRITGVDLSRPLSPAQAEALIGALDDWQVICLFG